MADSPPSSSLAGEEGREDSEWEYEYHETETEVSELRPYQCSCF